MAPSEQTQPGAPTSSSSKQTEPLPNDKDTNPITAQLTTHASTPSTAQEADHLHRTNALLREDMQTLRAELRASRQKQAVLDELRTELSPTRNLLHSLWRAVEDRRVRVPRGLMDRYEALGQGSAFDGESGYEYEKPAKAMSEGVRSGEKMERLGRGGNQSAVTGEGETTLLLHMHDGKENTDDNTAVGDDKKEDEGVRKNVGEDGDSGQVDVAPSTDAQLSEVATSTDMVAGKKRKAVDQDGNVAKWLKNGNQTKVASSIITRSIAGLKRKRAIETVDTAREKQEVCKSEDENATGENLGEELEEGEIRD